MTHSEELQIAYEFAIGRVIDAAKLVSVFDGTDRASLDELRANLIWLTQVNEQVTEFLRGFDEA